MYRIIKPKTEQEFAAYYQFRWQLLRAPLNLPLGSEKDEYDSLSEHRMICNDDGAILAVARMHLSNADEVQIRHTAVLPDYRGQGLGSLLMSALEEAAHQMRVKRAVLFAREDSIGFYEKCGYNMTGEAPDEEGGIARCQMIKPIEVCSHFLRHPKWCQQLQKTWDDEIPVAHLMGIKVHQYTGHLFETRAALNANLNLHGTMFAGSIYSQATLTGWGMIFLMLKENGLEGEIVLGDGNIHYHKPITSEPKAICHSASVIGKLQALRKGRKTRIKLLVNILDGDLPVAEFEGIYVVLPSKQQSLLTELEQETTEG
ncbi:YiiD C-terminal domain-containing protein [Catenovulum sp. SM1970]|uniref:bifunctional GNAT family N-acetyltransferase/hotdog fold thioesterase n=1 Tax=Marinifaba aquimaris TaxID=2741323 RepID=UPI0015741728|nr:bifunctional GNAT family N-acetyltransferase/hotdog fold thioesterase [Marinifaba aquimaris]NTS76950.1 YiiD C-terminal domain-containing protein [Marinifaba aquimaris]